MFARRRIVTLAIAASLLPTGLAVTASAASPEKDGSTGRGVKQVRLHRGLPTLKGQIRSIERREERALARAQASIASYPPVLHRIAACESGNNPAAIGGGGAYRGLFQFAVGTWRNVGGSGDPAQASVPEQYKRAAMLLERSGTGQWPVCGA